DLLAHEIAHQWFGDMVTEKKYSHLWLSEGFATYMTDIYLESKYGKDNFISRLKRERNDVIDFNNGQTVVDSVSKGMSLLNVNRNYDEKDQIASATVTQLQKQNLLQIPFEIALATKTSKGKIQTLNITKEKETFTIKSPEAIINLELDPSVNLLFDQK